MLNQGLIPEAVNGNHIVGGKYEWILHTRNEIMKLIIKLARINLPSCNHWGLDVVHDRSSTCHLRDFHGVATAMIFYLDPPSFCLTSLKPQEQLEQPYYCHQNPSCTWNFSWYIISSKILCGTTIFPHIWTWFFHIVHWYIKLNSILKIKK